MATKFTKNSPVDTRLVPSGKVYRQMFEAQVYYIDDEILTVIT